MNTKSRTVAALERLLRPVARLLIRNNFSFRDFNEVAKLVFVDEASKLYGIRGRPTNTSRIAVLVGLTRREVARLRKVAGIEELPLDYLTIVEQLARIWPRNQAMGERYFQIPMEGAGSLVALIEKIKKDVPTTVIVKELARNHMIKICGQYVSLVSVNVPKHCEAQVALSRLSQAVAALGDTVSIENSQAKNVFGIEPYSTRIGVTGDVLIDFEQFMKERAIQYQTDIEQWVEEHSDKGTKTTPFIKIEFSRCAQS